MHACGPADAVRSHTTLDTLGNSGWTPLVCWCDDECDALVLLHVRRITLPPAAHEAAAAKGKPADWLYCSELLEQTGIVVVPGRRRGGVRDT